jgi:hypothetical protein
MTDTFVVVSAGGVAGTTLETLPLLVSVPLVEYW